MNLFKRIFKIGESEAHSALDKLEDPVKLTEQGIRDLKKDMEEAMSALAEVKALAIRTRNESEKYKAQAADYEQKAMMLLTKAGNGEMDATEADRLASESLRRKNESEEQHQRTQKELQHHESGVSKLETNVKRLRTDISKWENELRTLKARAKVSAATKNINKQMAAIDSSSTVSMLEKMKDKVAQEEALAESYADIANESKSVDDEIDKALEGSASVEVSSDLAALKAKLNANKQ